MARLILAIVLGIVFPTVCFSAVGLISDFIAPSVLTEVEIEGEWMPGILAAPFSIPIYVSIYLKQMRLLPDIFDTTWFRLSFLVVFNWFCYGILAYWALGRMTYFNQRQVLSSEQPPPPPYFEEKEK